MAASRSPAGIVALTLLLSTVSAGALAEPVDVPDPEAVVHHHHHDHSTDSTGTAEACDPSHDKTCIVPVPGEPVLAYVIDEALGPTAGLPWHGNATIHEEDRVEGGGVGASYNVTAQFSWNVTAPREPRDAGGSSHVVVPCSDPRGCPDLTVDRVDLVKDLRVTNRFFFETDCNVAEGSAEPGFRRILRFTLTAPNVGDGDVHVGQPASWPDLFEWGDCHGHWHFISFADYRLWTTEGYQEWQEARRDDPDALPSEILADHPDLEPQLVQGRKQGFCMMDVKVQPTELGSPRNHPNCSNQGVSRGWSDSYNAGLDGQFIDVTGVPPGWYVMEAETNPDRLIEEMRYTNNAESLLLFLPPST